MTSKVITTSITASIVGAPTGLFTLTGEGELSVDLDRNPFGELTLGIVVPVADIGSTYLDTRAAVRTLTASITVTTDGVPVTQNLSLFLREVKWTDKIAGLATLRATTWEVAFDDRVRLGAMTDTGSTTLQALVNWFRADTAASLPGFPATITGTAPLASIALPAGERRQWMQGQTAADALEAELQAQGGRIRGTLDGGLVYQSANSPTSTVAVLLAADDLIGLSEVVTRDGDWGDAVLVRFQYVNPAGVMTTTHQFASGAIQTRGRVVSENRTPPSANVATQMLTRVANRGSTATMQMPVAFAGNAEIGNHVELYAGAGLGAGAPMIHRGQIRSIVRRFPDGTMTCEVKS